MPVRDEAAAAARGRAGRPGVRRGLLGAVWSSRSGPPGGGVAGFGGRLTLFRENGIYLLFNLLILICLLIIINYYCYLPMLS